MMITKENYQVLLDDFIAGKLSPELEEEFMLFLEANPQLSTIDLTEEELPHLENDFISGLKKDLSFDENNLDELIIAQLEGDLSLEESERLDSYLAKHEDKDRERRLYMHTMLRPSLEESFGDRTPLYRKKAFVIPRIVWYSGAIAAGLAIFVLMFTRQPEDKSLGFVDRPIQTEQKTKAQSETSTQKADQAENQGVEKASSVQPLKSTKPTKLISFPSLDTEDRPYLKTDETIPNLQASIEPSLAAENPMQIAMAIETLPVEIEIEESPSENLSLLQFAYKKIRKSFGEDELVVAEEEIPKDAASILVAKVKPLISYQEAEEGVSFRIGSLEFKRKSK